MKKSTPTWAMRSRYDSGVADESARSRIEEWLVGIQVCSVKRWAAASISNLQYYGKVNESTAVLTRAEVEFLKCNSADGEVRKICFDASDAWEQARLQGESRQQRRHEEVLKRAEREERVLSEKQEWLSEQLSSAGLQDDFALAAFKHLLSISPKGMRPTHMALAAYKISEVCMWARENQFREFGNMDLLDHPYNGYEHKDWWFDSPFEEYGQHFAE